VITATEPTSPTRPLHLAYEGPIRPTPAGAYRAVARARTDSASGLLRAVLRETTSPDLTEAALLSWTGTDDLQAALRVLQAAQEDGLVEAMEEAVTLPDAPLDQLLPPLMPSLSDEGRVLLADEEGLVVAACGFEEQVCARLAAMSADLGSLHDRHSDTLDELVHGRTAAWALVDGIGASQLGCWPIYTGSTRFVLVAQGLPRLHHVDFTALVWLLVSRYG
jgi:hypothetical protein